jgi:hypothetical protein
MAPNNTPMIVGPIKINSFGKQTDRVLSKKRLIETEQKLKEKQNKLKIEEKE